MGQPDPPVDVPAVPGEPPLFDPGNPFIQAQPAMLSAKVVRNPQTGGEVVAVTLRVGNATVSAILEKQDCLNWAAVLNGEAAKISGLVLASGPLR